MNASRFRLGALALVSSVAVLASASGAAWAAPKATAKVKVSDDAKYIRPVDISKIEGTPIVLVNPSKEVVVAFPEHPDARLFFGTEKGMYEQLVQGRSRDGADWTIHTIAPRIAEERGGSIARKSAFEYQRYCGGDEVDKFAPMSEPDSVAFLAKAKFFTSPLTRTPTVLGRDSAGTYYYVDALRPNLGGASFRVFVGRKGAMKQRPLLDVASDTVGTVLSTKSGEIRLVTRTGSREPHGMTWYAQGKATELVMLNIFLE
ncbi:MAG: hypothetical protein KBG15_19570, partial [Kofleriaceae bacterium]|nr:hypothetical protein [Kofleriaceae bacterium]